MCIQQRKKVTPVPDTVEGDTLKAFSISLALMGSGEFNRKSQNCLSWKFIYGSCRNKGTNKNWPFYFMCTCIHTPRPPHLNTGAVLPQCLDENSSLQLLTHETWVHSWVTGYHTFSHSVVLWGRACRLSSSPHLRRVSCVSLVLAVIALVKLMPTWLLIRYAASHLKLLKLQKKKLAAHKKRVI